MLKKARIAVLVSGGGTNLQALIDSEKEKKLSDMRVRVENAQKREKEPN